MEDMTPPPPPKEVEGSLSVRAKLGKLALVAGVLYCSSMPPVPPRALLEESLAWFREVGASSPTFFARPPAARILL